MQTRYYDPEVGRFISQDSLEYADPETINGLNLYAYCGNNPVMGYDPTGTWNWGNFWKAVGAALLITVVVAVTAVAAVATGGVAGAAIMAVAAGIALGAIGGGVSAAVSGTDVAAGILGGAIKGGAAGVAFGLGIATAGAGLSIGTGLFAAVGVNFVAGMANYVIDNGLNDRQVTWQGALASGALQAVSGALAYFAGVAIGSVGTYNIPQVNKILSATWIKNFAVATLIKSVIYYPLNWVINQYQRSKFGGQ